MIEDNHYLTLFLLKEMTKILIKIFILEYNLLS
jgi:hypothetical protein